MLLTLRSLASKSKFAGDVIVTTGLRIMHFSCPGNFLRWNSNLQQVDFPGGGLGIFMDRDQWSIFWDFEFRKSVFFGYWSQLLYFWGC